MQAALKNESKEEGLQTTLRKREGENGRKISLWVSERQKQISPISMIQTTHSCKTSLSGAIQSNIKDVFQSMMYIKESFRKQVGMGAF